MQLGNGKSELYFSIIINTFKLVAFWLDTENTAEHQQFKDINRHTDNTAGEITQIGEFKHKPPLNQYV